MRQGGKQMNETLLKPGVKYAVVLTYLGMILVNALANILPINGITTGEVSDAYPNLFAPAGITFAIWGVIYLLLAGYTLYQMGVFGKEQGRSKQTLLDSVGILFSISSVANMVWILSWHYRLIPASMLLMAVILVCLILINYKIRPESLTTLEKGLIRLPFSVYFGWISVATIANLTTLLVDMGWKGFGLSESTWTIIILLVGIAIGILTTLKNQDIAYGLVFVWAYSGILIKHISPELFNFKYPWVVYTAMIAISFMLLVIIRILLKMIRLEREKLSST